MACRANLCQAVLATGQDRLAQPGPDLGPLVSDVRARLELTDYVRAGE